MAALKIPVLYDPAATDLSQAYAEYGPLGEATGHVAQAAKEVATIKAKIAHIVATTPHAKKGTTYYYELEPDYYSVASSTFVGKLFSLARPHVDRRQRQRGRFEWRLPATERRVHLEGESQLHLPRRHALLSREPDLGCQTTRVVGAQRGEGPPGHQRSTTTSRRAGDRASRSCSKTSRTPSRASPCRQRREQPRSRESSPGNVADLAEGCRSSSRASASLS